MVLCSLSSLVLLKSPRELPHPSVEEKLVPTSEGTNPNVLVRLPEVLGLEPRALGTLGKHFIDRATPQPWCVILETGSHSGAQAGS